MTRDAGNVTTLVLVQNNYMLHTLIVLHAMVKQRDWGQYNLQLVLHAIHDHSWMQINVI